MTVTVAQVTAVVEEQRLNALLTHTRAITGSTVPEIGPCLAWALRMLGYTTASIVDADDDEVAQVADSRIDALLDLVELRMLQSAQTNLTSVTNQTGPVRDDWNDLAKRVGDQVAAKVEAVSAQHGRLLKFPLTANAPQRTVVRAV